MQKYRVILILIAILGLNEVVSADELPPLLVEPNEVIVWEHSGWNGDNYSWTLEPNMRHQLVNQLPGRLNDEISSILVGSEVKVITYRHSDFAGPSKIYESQVYSLSDYWNDEISSLIIFPKAQAAPKGVILSDTSFHTVTGYDPVHQFFPLPEYLKDKNAPYPSLGDYTNDKAEYVLIQGDDVNVTLHRHANFQGDKLTLPNGPCGSQAVGNLNGYHTFRLSGCALNLEEEVSSLEVRDMGYAEYATTSTAGPTPHRAPTATSATEAPRVMETVPDISALGQPLIPKESTSLESISRLSGRVYVGEVGVESSPLGGASLELYCSNDLASQGKKVDSTSTNSDGWYELTAPPGCEFYTIIMKFYPWYYSEIGATSVGGRVIDSITIQYAYPLEGKVITGNKFWLNFIEETECPEGCVCLSWKDQAKWIDEGLTTCYCPWCPSPNMTLCGYDEDGEPMVCFGLIGDVPDDTGCPEGCECLIEEVAAEKFGRFEQCSNEICEFGEDQNPMYCFRPIAEPSPEKPHCPEGCECMTEEMAKQEFGKYEKCSEEICGYDQRTPMYCLRFLAEPSPETSRCPQGCECMTKEMAEQEFGRYERCSEEICDYDQDRNPLYCFRSLAEPSPEPSRCPEGCECMTEEMAEKEFGRYERCSKDICGYDDRRTPLYCFRSIGEVPEETACPEGCVCLSEKQVTETKPFYYCYGELNETIPCGSDQDGEPMFCRMPVCPDGCECLMEEVAAEKFGRYEKCKEWPCGYSPQRYCFRPIEPTSQIGPESYEVFFSTEEDFITHGPVPPDGNSLISDGDLLGPGCIVFARNRELLAAFEMELDLGLDAVDVIDTERPLIAFSAELDDPLGRFTAGDLLVTNGVVIPNKALLVKLEIQRIDFGLDAVHFVGDPDNIINFLDNAYMVSRDEYLRNPGILPEMLNNYGIDIWFSTEGTATEIENPLFLDGDLLSARYGIKVVPNVVLLTSSLPAGIPSRGVDFGLDAVTAGRDGKRDLIRFSTEIRYEGDPAFGDGDVLILGDGVACTNKDLIHCFEPETSELGLDAISFVAT